MTPKFLNSFFGYEYPKNSSPGFVKQLELLTDLCRLQALLLGPLVELSAIPHLDIRYRYLEINKSSPNRSFSYSNETSDRHYRYRSDNSLNNELL
jgi:hypothetical protein